MLVVNVAAASQLGKPVQDELCADDALARGSSRKGYSPSGREINRTGSGCAICKVYICKKCYEDGSFKAYAHPGDCSGEGSMNLRD